MDSPQFLLSGISHARHPLFARRWVPPTSHPLLPFQLSPLSLNLAAPLNFTDSLTPKFIITIYLFTPLPHYSTWTTTQITSGRFNSRVCRWTPPQFHAYHLYFLYFSRSCRKKATCLRVLVFFAFDFYHLLVYPFFPSFHFSI